MLMQQIIQTLIHKLEVGGGARVLQIILLVLSILTLGILYDSCAFRNFSSLEAMDSAQLARNISEGKGYTTLFIRPLSLYLEQQHNKSSGKTFSTNSTPDYARIKGVHPDISNPPVYPFVLAGLMKVLPFHYDVNSTGPFWSNGGRFFRYQPDFLIAVFNQVLLLGVVILTFLIARKLFDATAAWLSATLTIGCELLWHFSASGLSTMLLLLIFLCLIWCVVKIEEIARTEQTNPRRLLFWVLVAAALIGIGALTRYSFVWLIVPLIIFLILFSGKQRVLHSLAAFAVCAAIFSPWVIRNYSVSGTPFGTATYAYVEDSYVFQNFKLERSTQPNTSLGYSFTPYTHKLIVNLRDVVQHDLPQLGGSWATTLFLAGLLLGFRNVATQRIRYFLLMCLGILALCQAMGQTGISTESPEINSENLLVLLAPLIFMYGASLFLTFLEQMTLPILQLRYVIIGLFVAISCLPMISTLCPPRSSPIAYPPYYPPEIQQTSQWMKEDELMMSDIPWAVAWYGDRQCVWLTLDAQDEFFYINNNLKPVQALYLTPETTDTKFVSGWIAPREFSWSSFIVQAILQGQIPPNFPLRYPPPQKLIPERLFLTDRERWKLAPQPAQ